MKDTQPSSSASRDWNEVLSYESAYINENRSENDPRTEITGLALSGGGIRSASFALGVIQALQKYNCLESFRYLSTVSGGGYMGVALSWLRKKYPSDWGRHLRSKGTRRFREDFFNGIGTSSKIQNNGVWLDFIRQHSNYLQPPDIGVMSLVGVAVRSFLLSVAVYVGLVAIILAPLHRFEAFPNHDTADSLEWCFQFEFFGFGFTPHIIFDVWGLVAMLVGCLLLVYILFSIGTFAISLESKGELVGLAMIVAISAFMVFIGLRPDALGTQSASERITSAILAAGILCLYKSSAVLFKRVTAGIESEAAGDPALYHLRLKLQKGSGWLLIAIMTLMVVAILPEIDDLLDDKGPIALAVLMGSAATAYRFFMVGRRVVPRPVFTQVAIVLVFALTVISAAVVAYLVAKPTSPRF